MALITIARAAAPYAVKAAKHGYKAYKLGRKSKALTVGASKGSSQMIKAKSYSRAANTAFAKGLTSSPLRFKRAARLGSFAVNAKKASKVLEKRAVKNLAGAKAINKIKKSGSMSAKLGLFAGKNRNKILGGLAVGAGAIGIKKRKPMSAATKRKISQALKGKKRKR